MGQIPHAYLGYLLLWLTVLRAIAEVLIFIKDGFPLILWFKFLSYVIYNLPELSLEQELINKVHIFFPILLENLSPKSTRKDPTSFADNPIKSPRYPPIATINVSKL